MQKFVLAVAAVLMSCSAYAGDKSPVDAGKNSQFIYVGKDVSHPEVADAKEPIWSGNEEFLA